MIDFEKMSDPYDGIEWKEFNPVVTSSKGEIIFKSNKPVTFPDFFDENCATIVTSKYLHNIKVENYSLKNLIDRVADTITKFADEQSYFKTKKDLEIFNKKLKYYQVNQYFAFNSPVYFNVGTTDKPQTSACFILGIEDNMDSIFETAKLESRIFKNGSGSGMNISPLRSSKETLSSGGTASGPISFLKAHDTIAGVIRSGGTLRRSAKMVCMNIDHPDIEEFITCKKKEEEKMTLLKNEGFEPKQGEDFSDQVFFQNTNISVRVNDEFMNAVENEDNWNTLNVTNRKKHKKYKAKNLLKQIATLAWETADPGLLFDSKTNEMNTCKNSGRINSSNPCGEYVFLDDSSCNLASLNLLKFVSKIDEKYVFDFDTFFDVIETTITAQDVIINKSSYPNEKIEYNSKHFRPLGLGYTNLGSLLMFLGLPYDSNEGRIIAALISSLLTGCAYKTSSKLGEELGSFTHFEENKEHFLDVMNKHKTSLNDIFPYDELSGKLLNLSMNIWDDVCSKNNFRNAQTTVIAPTGTISFLMGAITTGLEPEFSHIKYKRLSGTDGATITITSPILPIVLKNLNYTNKEIKKINDYMLKECSLEGCKDLNEEHLPIFDTAVGKRCIDYMGHVKMMAAIQPFISGALSKTVNVNNEATIDDVFNLYLDAWKMGLKGITIYRDGSKNFQPLSTSKEVVQLNTKDVDKIKEIILNFSEKDKRYILNDMVLRNPMPSERGGNIHKFKIGTTKGYLITGTYPKTNKLGEVFINIAKEGSTLSGLLDSFALLLSISLQHGVPLKTLVHKLMLTKFDPSGFTNNPDIRVCTSIIDYIMRYLGNKYLPIKDRRELGLTQQDDLKQMEKKLDEAEEELVELPEEKSATLCSQCGSEMIRKGSCLFCTNCAYNEGSCG